MSVFGIDLGALNSTVAVTRAGGVDIVCNEVSKRETATFVSYNGDERLIGEAGFDKAVRNANNTIPCVKRFIGMSDDDPRLAAEKRFVYCGVSSDDQGKVQFNVDYNDESVSLYPEQVLAAFVGKLRKYVVHETKVDAKDCVVSVPVWYTADQRKKVMQACEMAGVHALSLINETTAAGVDYGIFRGAELPEKEDAAHIVAIVDVGYAGTTITIAKFWRGNMKVLAHAWDHDVCTRELDYALYKKFAEDIKAKYKVDVTENKRARIRLMQGCDRLKCMLSANPTAPLNIENLMDVDIAFLCTREELEVTLNPLCEKLRALAQRAMSLAGIEAGALTAVEMIGGGSRVPGYKAATSEAFGIPASFTLNASESIARGCAITAAAFSPLFQVREYVVNEAPLCPLMFGYHSDKAETVSSVSFLPAVNKTTALLRDTDRYPKVLDFTFQRSEEFELYAFYDENHDNAKYVPQGARSIIGHWVIGGFGSKKTSGSVKVTVKFHASGLVTLESASTHEVYEIEVEEKVKEEAKPAAAAPAEGAEAPKEGEEKPAEEKPAEKPATVKVKKPQQRRMELTLTPKVLLGHSSEVFLACKKAEADQDAKDLTIQKTREVRNELEAYVYDNRSRVSDGDLKPFVTEADGATFVAQATEIEDWLYGDGDNAPLGEYQSRLDKLKVIGAAAIRRLRLSEDIPFAQAGFEKKVTELKDLAAAKMGKAAHISDEEINGAIAKCDEAIAWGKSELEAFQAKPKFEEPSLAPTTFDNKLKEVDAAVKAVVNKKAPPPPKKEEPKKEEAPKKDGDAAAPAADAEKPAAEAAPEGSPKGPEAPADLD